MADLLWALPFALGAQCLQLGQRPKGTTKQEEATSKYATAQHETIANDRECRRPGRSPISAPRRLRRDAAQLSVMGYPAGFISQHIGTPCVDSKGAVQELRR